MDLMMSTRQQTWKAAVIGGGPAGLTAAYVLAQAGVPVIVLEADPTYVGGISRTVKYKGFCFDMGGHRFYTKSSEIEALWHQLLPVDFLERPRKSRIYYRGKFIDYPLRATDALSKLGIAESFLCGLSYAKSRMFPFKNPSTFQEWVTNQFGARLYRIFFKTYTEKVWGMSCSTIDAAWAAQRIKGLSLASAVLEALKGRRAGARGKGGIKTLISSFLYPRLGPGQLWEACAQKIRSHGGQILMGHSARSFTWDSQARLWSVRLVLPDQTETVVEAEHLVSTTALQYLVPNITPALSEQAQEAARSLKYRDFLTVALILRERDLFPDNWIYVHDPSVKVGRIQNYKAWSPAMVPDDGFCCYGLEYFCNEGDELWSMPDEELIRLGTRELGVLGLARPEDVVDAAVARQPKAYPVYDRGYASKVEVIRRELEAKCATLHVAGRNGMHFYNSQDHSMMTGILAAENVIAGRRLHDVWKVTEDAEYAEEGGGGQRAVLSELRAAPTPAAEARDGMAER
jgi:protoporphyrinogen oxidase